MNMLNKKYIVGVAKTDANLGLRVWFLISSNHLFVLPGGKHLFQDSGVHDLARGLRVSQKPMSISPSDIKDTASSLWQTMEGMQKEEMVRHPKIVA